MNTKRPTTTTTTTTLYRRHRWRAAKIRLDGKGVREREKGSPPPTYAEKRGELERILAKRSGEKPQRRRHGGAAADVY